MSLSPRTPHTFAAEAATSSLMNAEVKALWDGLLDNWSTYTPSWTSTGTAPSLGNGAIAGRYFQIGQTVLWRISWQAGSTTTFGTGFYSFSLPAALDWNQYDAIGQGTVLDFSATDVYGYTAAYDGSGSVRLYGNAAEKVGATSPITFNTSDRIIISGIGELS